MLYAATLPRMAIPEPQTPFLSVVKFLVWRDYLRQTIKLHPLQTQIKLLQMTARNHHYISKCYLKGFVKDPDKPQLYVIDTRKSEPYKTSTDNIGSRRDFHRIEINGLAPDALESALAGFEGELGPALRRIESARSLDDFNDRILLLNLICMIHIKNPQMRKIHHDFEEDIMRKIMNIVISSKEIFENQMQKARKNGFISSDDNVDYEIMKKFVEEDAFKIEIPNERHLRRELDLFDEVLPYFFKRKWHLLRAPEDKTGFVTSDNPVVLQWQNPQLRSGPYPPGLALHGTELIFPICNTLAMVGTFEEEEMQVDVTPEFLAKINGTIISRSKNQIYARDDDFLCMFNDQSGLQSGKDLIKYTRIHSTE